MADERDFRQSSIYQSASAAHSVVGAIRTGNCGGCIRCCGWSLRSYGHGNIEQQKCCTDYSDSRWVISYDPGHHHVYAAQYCFRRSDGCILFL